MNKIIDRRHDLAVIQLSPKITLPLFWLSIIPPQQIWPTTNVVGIGKDAYITKASTIISTPPSLPPPERYII